MGTHRYKHRVVYHPQYTLGGAPFEENLEAVARTQWVCLRGNIENVCIYYSSIVTAARGINKLTKPPFHYLGLVYSVQRKVKVFLSAAFTKITIICSGILFSNYNILNIW